MGKYITTDNLEPGLLAIKSYIDSNDVQRQPILIDGENIKTINGQSILGEGDLTIGWTEEEFTGEQVVLNLMANVFYYNYTPVSTLQIVGVVVSTPLPQRELYKVAFKTADSCSLTLPIGVYWANGVIPEILPNTIYELSIEYSLDVYKAILLPFNQV